MNKEKIGDNADLIIRVIPNNHNKFAINISKITAVKPNLEEIAVEDFKKHFDSDQDFNGDGVADERDVAFVIRKIFGDELTVKDLQRLINEL